MSDKTVMAIVALTVPAGLLLAVLAVGRSDRYRFSLRTTLLWFVPFAALIAWVSTWEGPLSSDRRVITHKTAMLAVLLNAGVCIAMWRKGWFRPQVALVFVTLFALMFCSFAWNRHQDHDPARTQTNAPAPANSSAVNPAP